MLKKGRRIRLTIINGGQDLIIQTFGVSYEIIGHGRYKTKRILFMDKQVGST